MYIYDIYIYMYVYIDDMVLYGMVWYMTYDI